jgi:hypothetical protein
MKIVEHTKKEVIPTHKIVLRDDVETKHCFDNGDLVKIRPDVSMKNGQIVLVIDQQGIGQMVDQKELQPLPLKF